MSYTMLLMNQTLSNDVCHLGIRCQQNLCKILFKPTLCIVTKWFGTVDWYTLKARSKSQSINPSVRQRLVVYFEERNNSQICIYCSSEKQLKTTIFIHLRVYPSENSRARMIPSSKIQKQMFYHEFKFSSEKIVPNVYYLPVMPIPSFLSFHSPTCPLKKKPSSIYSLFKIIVKYLDKYAALFNSNCYVVRDSWRAACQDSLKYFEFV